MNLSLKKRIIIGICSAFIIVSIIGIYLFNYNNQKIEYTFSGAIMGCTYHGSYFINKKLANPQVVITEVDKALRSVDQSMSTYKNSSELMKLNNWPINTPFKVSPELANVLSTSFEISKISHGYYDVTIGKLVNLWGFGPSSEKNKPSFIDWQNGSKKPLIPTEAMIKAAKNDIGYKYINLDIQNLTIIKSKNVFIDLSSIAKGFGVDQAAKAMQKLNIQNFLIEVGGEIYAAGKKNHNKPWIVAIRSPKEQEPMFTLNLEHEAMATSGDYLNYFESNNHIYNHEIDVTTGFPENHNIASTTVIAKNTMLADAYSTMLMVNNLQNSKEFVEQNTMPACIVFREIKNDKTVFKTFMNEKFKNKLYTRKDR